jgi:hypothetical protein
MSISRQIGWSQEANLLFEIYRELENINKVAYITTTTTTTPAP